MFCSCLLFSSCSSDDDPVKSYSNYQITVDATSPLSFAALGETHTITVSATKEICWDGKPSGEKEAVKVTASVEGEPFTIETSQTDATLQLKITAKENEKLEVMKGKVVLTIQEDATTETQTIELSQDAATVAYGAYQIAFAEESVSLDYTGGKGTVAFICQREMTVNGKSKGNVPYSLNGVMYEASQFNDITYQITKDGEETGKYLLAYDQPQAITSHEVYNTFTLIEKTEEGESELATFEILLAAHPDGEDSWFVAQSFTGTYQGE